MMKKILVTYATLSGTTVEVARVVAEEIEKSGAPAELLPIEEVKTLDGYAGVVIGAPMIMGWHRSGLGFLGKHRKAWRQLPFAIFATAMSLTSTSTATVGGVTLCIDENLPRPPQRAGHLTLRERYAQVENYARSILRAGGSAKPVSLAFFGGRLEYGRLPWWAVVFAMLIIQAPAGDKHNWPFIRKWASGIPDAFRRAASSATERKQNG
jgi:menaquinone-dependent protoporphyrinogen IX oxidase